MNRTLALRYPAFAAVVLLASPLAGASEPGWYLGGSAGVSRAKIADERIKSGLLGSGLVVTSIADDDRDVGFKLFGGYQFNRYFALEGGYVDLGKFSFDATTAPAGTLAGSIRLRGVNLDVVGTLPVTDRFSVFGRVGATYAQARDSFSGGGAVVVTTPNPKKRAANYKVGVGLGYALTDSIDLRAEAERYRVDDAVHNKGDIDLFSVGIVYRFGAKTPTAAPRVAALAPVAAAAPPPPAPPAPPPPPPPPSPTRVTFSADSLFDFDRATIRRAGGESLDRFAVDLKGTRYDQVAVTGHTDRLGRHDYNLRLSTRRAEAVKAHLVRAGIAADRITVRGVDGANPVTNPAQCKGTRPTAALIACLQPDRRVEVEVSATR